MYLVNKYIYCCPFCEYIKRTKKKTHTHGGYSQILHSVWKQWMVSVFCEWHERDQISSDHAWHFCLTKASSGSPEYGKSVLHSLKCCPKSHGLWSEAFLESSNTLHFIIFKGFYFPFSCTPVFMHCSSSWGESKVNTCSACSAHGSVHLCHVPLTLPCLFQDEGS